MNRQFEYFENSCGLARLWLQDNVAAFGKLTNIKCTINARSSVDKCDWIKDW